MLILLIFLIWNIRSSHKIDTAKLGTLPINCNKLYSILRVLMDTPLGTSAHHKYDCSVRSSLSSPSTQLSIDVVVVGPSRIHKVDLVISCLISNFAD